MARLKLQITGKELATFRIPVRITDINYGNHLGNNAMVEIIHEARMQFLQLHDFTELQAGGTALIMSELSVEFKQESFYQDILMISVYCGEISRVGFELFYKISVTRDGKTILIANAKTGMVCFNYEQRVTESVPEGLKAILK
ncbi:MAG: thioesterase family protein [Ginsengibacter sp.]